MGAAVRQRSLWAVPVKPADSAIMYWPDDARATAACGEIPRYDITPKEAYHASPDWRAGWTAADEGLTHAHNPHHPAGQHQAYADWRDGMEARHAGFDCRETRLINEAFGLPDPD